MSITIFTKRQNSDGTETDMEWFRAPCVIESDVPILMTHVEKFFIRMARTEVSLTKKGM
jgi:hypothetical protein